MLPIKRKRGRPSLAERRQAEDGGDGKGGGDTLSDKGKTQRRRSGSKTKPTKTAADGEGSMKRPKPQRKARRPSQAAEADDEQGSSERQENPRKRGRPPRKSIQEDEQQEGEEEDLEGEQNEQRQRSQEAPQRNRRRGRPSLKELDPQLAQNAQAQDGDEYRPEKRRGRPKAADKQALRRKEAPERVEPEPETTSSPPRSSSPSPEMPYQHLAPRTETIKPSLINSKWSPLAHPSLQAASILLDTAKYPILQRMSTTTNRSVHTVEALQLITKRISHKLARGLPFPRSAMLASSSSSSTAATDSGRATEFNFENVLDARNLLERQVEPVLRAVEVLRREKDKEEKQLRMDYDLLRKLEGNARTQGREQRGLLKRVHPLLGSSPADNQGKRRAGGRDGKDEKITEGLGNVFQVRHAMLFLPRSSYKIVL